MLFALHSSGTIKSASKCAQGHCSIAAPLEGAWTIWLVTTDAAGNVERLPVQRSVVVDLTTPKLTWDWTAQQATRNGAATLRTSWTATVFIDDTTTCVLSVRCINERNQSSPVATTELRKGMFQLSMEGLSDSVWSLHVAVRDGAGHVALPWSTWWLVDVGKPELLQLELPAPVLAESTSLPQLYATSFLSLTAVQCHDGHGGCHVRVQWRRTASFSGAVCSSAASATSAVASSDWLNATSALAGLLDGVYELDVRVTDAVGNSAMYATYTKFGVDTIVPSLPSINVDGLVLGGATKESQLLAAVELQGDGSPLQDRLSLWYSVDGSDQHNTTTVQSIAADGSVLHHALVKLSGLSDGDHVLEAWAVDAAGNRGIAERFLWSVQSSAPETLVLNPPAKGIDVALGFVWQFHLQGLAVGRSTIAELQTQLDDDTVWRRACAEAECWLSMSNTKVGIRTLKVRAVSTLQAADDSPVVVTWSVKQCNDDQVANIDAETGALHCTPCPAGGNCHGGTATPEKVVAKSGFWASAQNADFYPCPLEGACLGGLQRVNATVTAQCAEGYEGVLCSMCSPGYFLRFGQCAQCTASSSFAWLALVGVSVLLAFVIALAFKFRQILPQTDMKISLAMMQIIGSANTTFSAPWPADLVNLLNAMKVFVLELLTLTQASCATPVTFYTNYAFTVFGMVGVSVLMVTGIAVRQVVTKRPQKLLVSDFLKPLFMFWLLCYPAVSLKLFQVFNCATIEGVPRLRADMRITCDDGSWAAYAAISAVLLVVFTIGLPAGIAMHLFKHRAQLQEPTTLQQLGFLYEQYGPHAYAWEPVELVRKLVLTSALSIMDTRSSLALTLATLVSAFAHVLHATYKPFVEKKHYWLQHVSLTVTTLVFISGLTFKVQGVDATSWGYTALSVLLIIACSLALALLVLVGGHELWTAARQLRRINMLNRQSLKGDETPRARRISSMNPMHALEGTKSPVALKTNPLASRSSFSPAVSDQ